MKREALPPFARGKASLTLGPLWAVMGTYLTVMETRLVIIV